MSYTGTDYINYRYFHGIHFPSRQLLFLSDLKDTKTFHDLQFAPVFTAFTVKHFEVVKRSLLCDRCKVHARDSMDVSQHDDLLDQLTPSIMGN